MQGLELGGFKQELYNTMHLTKATKMNSIKWSSHYVVCHTKKLWLNLGYSSKFLHQYQFKNGNSQGFPSLIIKRESKMIFNLERKLFEGWLFCNCSLVLYIYRCTLWQGRGNCEGGSFSHYKDQFQKQFVKLDRLCLSWRHISDHAINITSNQFQWPVATGNKAEACK